MRDILLTIFAAMMLFATFRHGQALVRRERHMRSMYRAIAEAGKRVMGSNKNK